MNTLLAISAIETYARATQELTALISKAQTENRDVTDEELATLRTSNDVLEHDLLKRLI